MPKTIILCHKCSGVLASEGSEDHGLLGCGCISGYVRGFEIPVDRAGAIERQIAAQCKRIETYTRQKLEPEWIRLCQKQITRLEKLA
jgi:hypothetical protein